MISTHAISARPYIIHRLSRKVLTGSGQNGKNVSMINISNNVRKKMMIDNNDAWKTQLIIYFDYTTVATTMTKRLAFRRKMSKKGQNKK